MSSLVYFDAERFFFELRFQALHFRGPSLSFPCEANGTVNLDELSERQRANYLYARAMVGRDYAAPEVVRGCITPEACSSSAVNVGHRV